MIDEAELRALSPAERRQLAHSLAALDYPRPRPGVYAARRRRIGILISVVSCVVLAAWIIVLGLTLHRSFHTHHWRGAWVGFDVILLFAFAATGWALWRGRQIVIACLIVTGTLLCCDAWFDIVLDAGTSEVWMSVASALFVELPMAFLMFNGARRLIRLSALLAIRRPAGPGDAAEPAGLAGEGPAGLLEDVLPPLWRLPLFGERPRDRDPASR